MSCDVTCDMYTYVCVRKYILLSHVQLFCTQVPSLQQQYNLHSSLGTTADRAANSKWEESGSPDTKVESRDVVVARTSASDTEVNGFVLPSIGQSLGNLDSHASPKSHDVVSSHGDSDSSSWSSSDEEEGGVMKDEMKPSTHSTLIAEWEWRAMNPDPTTR